MPDTTDAVFARGAQDAEDLFQAAATWEAIATPWSSSEIRQLECCRVSAETHDVKSFEFRLAGASPVGFLPGQFITLRVAIDGSSLSRCYTLASSPTRPFTLAITVKRVPGGAVSNWLHDHMRVGTQLEAFGPAGQFTPAPGQRRKSLYLSAGSGVTPLMAMTRAGIDLGLNRDVVFVHSARTPGDIVFRKELAALQARSSALRVIAVCEAKGDEPDWDGPTGRLSLELLQQLVPDCQEREVFCCGPAGYMAATQQLLLRGQHAPAHFHMESFDLGAAASDAVEVAEAPQAAGADGGAGQSAAVDAAADVGAAVPAAATSYSVRLAKSGKTVTVNPAQMLLAALRGAGIPVPSSCGKGLCGTCKTLLVEGQVSMAHQGGIRQREIDKGLRLLCCSRAESDLVLDL
jgi:ferredoxin-NADP reductase